MEDADPGAAHARDREPAMKRFRIVSLSLLMAAGVIWVLLEFRPREDPRAGPPGGGAAEGSREPGPDDPRPPRAPGR
jgi:hypothetical protein